ncbi:hypothetical protein MMC25_001892 [Agyrium rufum]|nr:hypothetical protein [Agyrium rufum]
MAPSKVATSLVGMIDSDLEDDLLQEDVEMMPTPDSNQENTSTATRGRGKSKSTTNKPRKTKAASRRLSGGTTASKAKAPGAKKSSSQREPLKEQLNEERTSDTEEVDEFEDGKSATIKGRRQATTESVVLEEEEPVKKSGKRGRKPGPAKLAERAAAAQPESAIEAATKRDGEFEYTPTTVKQSKIVDGSGLAKKRSTRQRTGSTQPQPKTREPPQADIVQMELDESESLGQDMVEPQEQIEPIYQPSQVARASSKQRQPPAPRVRTGSASDTDRAGGSDPVLRRKLGDMTRKYESLDLKYRNLREVGIKEAETNFEKLRKASEERSKVSNDLISSLRAELASQKAINAELSSVRTQLNTSNTSLQTSQSQISQLNALLSTAQNENKTLMAKLAASRAQPAANEPATSAIGRTPGSAVKGKSARPLTGNAAEAAAQAHIAGLKEDLYADLTGLIVRGVDKGEEADTYDCLQTGRNGTLHFHLAIPTPAAVARRQSSYEDTEFTYTPRLDANRDRELLEMMPDYLTEEITFSRINASRFYGRVVDVLTRKQDD